MTRSPYRPRRKISRPNLQDAAVHRERWACVYCGKDPCPVTRSGYVGSHLTAGGIMCAAVGMRAAQNLAHRLSIDDAADGG